MTVSLPFFEGGKRISSVLKSKAALKGAVADERSGRDSVLVTLEQAWKDLKDTVEEVVVRQKFLVASEERAKITRAQYANGLTTFDTWTIIEDDLVSAQKAYLDVRTIAMIAEAYWIQAIGGTLEYDYINNEE